MLLLLLSLTGLAFADAEIFDLPCGAEICSIPYDREGNQNGTETCYSDEGRTKVIRELNWKDGRREGTVRCWRDGKKTFEAQYQNDALNGPYVQFNYDSNGDRVRLLEGNHEVGLSFSVKNGQVSKVHYCVMNGEPMPEARLNCEERDYGPYRSLVSSWLKEETLRLKTTAAQEAQRLNGPQESKDRDGKLRAKWTNVKGEIQGKYLAFGKAGNVVLDCEYAAGKKNGPCVEFDEEGGLDKRASWAQGKLQKEEVFFDNGVPEKILDHTAKEGICVTEFFETGKKFREYCQPQGRYASSSWRWSSYEGKYLEWDADGSVAIRGQFLKGKRDGNWEYYCKKDVCREELYQGGALIRSTHYTDSPPGRLIREYFPDGTLKSEKEFEGRTGNQQRMI